MPQSVTFSESDFEPVKPLTFSDDDFEPVQSTAPVTANTPVPIKIAQRPLALSPTAAARQFNKTASTAATHIGPRPADIIDETKPKIEDLEGPVSKKAFGISASDIADKLFPETAPRPTNPDPLVKSSQPVNATVYDMARRSAKMAAGIADWMQSPEAIAAALVEAVSAGTATPVVTSLLGAQFATQGGKQAVKGLEDMRKNGITPENAEQFLQGLAVAEGGLLGLAGAREPAKQITATKQKYSDLAKTKDWIERAKYYATEAASEKETTRGLDNQSIDSAFQPTTAEGVKDLDRSVARGEARSQPNQAARRAGIEVPETTIAEDPTLRFTDEELDELTRPEAAPAVIPIESQPIAASPTTNSVPLQTEEVAATTDSAPVSAPAPIEQPVAQRDMLEQLTSPESEAAQPATPPAVEEVANAPAQAPDTPRLESTLATLRSDLADLRTHKGHTDKAAGDAVLSDYLADLRDAADAHDVPAASEALDTAAASLQEGDRAAFATDAERARGEIRKAYGERLAQSEAKKLGIELPAKEAPPAKSASVPRKPKVEEPPKTARDRLVYDGAESEMQQFREVFNPNKQSLIEFVRGKGGVKDEGGDLASREANKQTVRFQKNLVQNKTGLPMDTARELAVEAGYLPEGTTISDFLDKIDQELRGQPVYSLHDEGLSLEESPLKGMGLKPDAVAKELDSRAGATFEKVRKAFRDAYAETHGEAMDAYLENATDEQKRDLFGDEAGTLNFEPGESKPLLATNAEDAMRMTAAGRRPEQLKEGKIFDETALVESELFQGKGGKQKNLSEDDVSFDFGQNITGRIDDFETRQKEELKALWKSAGKGETLGANLPIEIAAKLVAIGAAKIARGVVKFGQWSAAMIRELGEEVRPHLLDLYHQALDRAAQVRKLEADDYFNFRRVDISAAEREALRGQVIGVVLETGRIPKERESWATIQEEARRLAGAELVSQLDTAKDQQPELRAVRQAARQRINAVNREITEARVKAADLRGDEAFKAEEAIGAKEKDLRGLLDVWMRMRSEDGRNLAMHRMMADSTWDATYWLSRAKRAMGLPAGSDLPAGVQREIGDIITAGDNAAQRVEVAKKKLVAQGVLPAGGPDRVFPELTGPVETLRGSQKDIQDYRVGLDEINQQKIKLARKMKDLDRSGWLETLIALRNVGLLTGIKTHLRNIGGNMSFQVLEEVQRIPAATVDMLLSLKTGQRTVQGASAKAMAAAINEARTKGIKGAKQVMREGASVDELGKVELHRELNSGVKWLDTYARFVVRTMSAEDRVFKSYAFRRSLEEQAALQAKNGGQSVLETMRNPSETMIQQAIYDAEFSTFNNPNVIAQGLRSMQGRMRSLGTSGKLASAGIDVAVPFKNTPANIIARVFDYAGGGFVKAGFHAFSAMAQRAMTPALQKAISQGMGRGMVGAALITLGYSLAQKGLATGVQPTEPGQQGVAQAAGRLPGAIQVGGRWHEVAPFSPAGNLLTIGATVQRESSKTLRDEARRPGNIAAIATRTALDQPMLKGISDVVEAFQNPAAAGERVTSSTLGSFVPTLLADSAALFDPYMRDARSDSFIESLYKGFQNRTPGWRNLLPIRRDVLGEPTQEPGGVMINPMISPKAKELSDPAIQRLISTETSIGFPRRDPGESRESYSLRAQIVGREIKRRLDGISFDQTADIDQKRKQVKRAIDAARDQINAAVKPLKTLPEAERIARLKALVAQ